MSSIREQRTRRIVGFICGYLFDAGLVTLDQLDAALERQLQLTAQGRSLRLGGVLVEMGVITREQLQQATKRESNEESRPARSFDRERGQTSGTDSTKS